MLQNNMKDLSVAQTTCCRSAGPQGPWQLALHQAYPIQGGEEPVPPPRSGWWYCHCYWCVYGDHYAASPCRVYRFQAEPDCPGQISGWHPLAAAVCTLVYSLASADSLSRVRVPGCTLALNIGWLVSHMAQCGRVVQSARGIDRSMGCVGWMLRFIMRIPPDSLLLSLINLEDSGSHLMESLFVITDQLTCRWSGVEYEYPGAPCLAFCAACCKVGFSFTCCCCCGYRFQRR